MDSFTADLSRRILPTGGAIDFSQMYPMDLYTNDPTNPLYLRGDELAIDIHKAIAKLPRPKAGYTPGRYKSIG